MDLHFLLRNGISGGIFLFAFFAGLMLCDPGMFKSYFDFFIHKDNASFASFLSTTLIAATPIIGIVLQGIYLIALYLVGQMFSDDARRLVAARIYSLVEKNDAWPSKQKGLYQKNISSYYDDPIFVAFYHTHAPAHLVEWARRRRSYHYLGWTFIIGSLTGLLLGMSWPGLLSGASWPSSLAPAWDKILNDPRASMFVLSLMMAVASSLYLSVRMLRDADQMEAIWALAYLDARVGRPLKMQP